MLNTCTGASNEDHFPRKENEDAEFVSKKQSSKTSVQGVLEDMVREDIGLRFLQKACQLTGHIPVAEIQKCST